MGEDQSEAVRRERRAWLRVVPSSHHLRGYRDQALPPLHPYCYSEGYGLAREAATVLLCGFSSLTLFPYLLSFLNLKALFNATGILYPSCPVP